MNLSIKPLHFTKAGVWEEDRSLAETTELLAEAGFRHLDLMLTQREETEKIAEHLQKIGTVVIQSHIPFNRYKKNDYSVYKKTVMQCAENARILGSKILVVHGDEFDFANMTYTPEAALEFNYKFFYDVVDFAEKNGMRVAFECLFQERNRDPEKEPRFCSYVEDLCNLTDKFGTDTVGICWDTGHSKLQYGDEQFKKLEYAGKRVIATHIHDNYYDRDLHTFPFIGDINWQAVIRTLRKIEYKGDFNFELAYARLPSGMALDYLKLLYKAGQYIINDL